MKIVETYLKRSELSASNAIYLTLSWITDSERNTIDSCTCRFFVCIQITLPKLHSEVPLSNPFSCDYIKILLMTQNQVSQLIYGRHCLRIRLAHHALIYIFVRLARVDQVGAWIRQSS